MTEMEESVSALPAAFPTLEHLRVRVFRNQDWCRNILYARGGFTTYNESTTCNLFGAFEPDLPIPEFDATADTDFDAVAEALDETDVNVVMLFAEFGDEGQLTHARFHVESPGWDRWQYVYSPGYGQLDDIPNEIEYTPIDADWYFRWEDWN